MKEKVVVTGFNILSSLGLDWQTTWDGLIQGKSGIKPITLFDASESQTQFAGQLPDEFSELSGQYIKNTSKIQQPESSLKF